MSETALRLREEMMRLSTTERAELVQVLLDSLDEDIDPGYDPEQDEDLLAELQRREQEVLEGKAVLQPGWEALAALREKHS